MKRSANQVEVCPVGLLVAVLGCGGDGGAAPDAGATRSYALASSGAQLVLSPNPSIQLMRGDLATDVDVVLIHQEFYGLPWESFEAGTAPPPEWVAVMDALASDAAAVGPLFLSLQLVSGPGRRFLADRAVVADGELSTQGQWSEPCYDFATAPDGHAKRDAYLAYVDWMVRRFQPSWLNVAIEMNMFMGCGDSAWNALVEVERPRR